MQFFDPQDDPLGGTALMPQGPIGPDAVPAFAAAPPPMTPSSVDAIPSPVASVPSLTPEGLGLPPAMIQALSATLAPRPVAPPMVADDPRQGLMALATLGFMLGSGQRSGLAQGAGQGFQTSQALAQQTLNQRFLRQQAEVDRQNAQLAEQQRKAADLERQRQQSLQTYIRSVQPQIAAAMTPDQYRQIVTMAANGLQAAGFRIQPQWFMEHMPFRAPTIADEAQRVLNGPLMKSPLLQDELKNNPEAALDSVKVQLHTHGFDQPTENVSLREAHRLAGLDIGVTANGLLTTPLGQLDPWKGAVQVASGEFATTFKRSPDMKNAQDQTWVFKRAKELNTPASQQQGGLAGGLTDEGLDYAATQYRVTGVIPALGQGSRTARTSVVNKAAEQARLLGQSPAAAIQKQAAYKADAESLKKIRGMSAAAESFESKALQQADLIADLSRNVPRSKYPILNDAILSGRTRIEGDEAATLLLNAITTFSSEYAKIMEGSTGSAAGSSDASRAASAKLISGAMNQRTFESVVNLMKKEMRFTIQGYDATVDHITTRMGGTVPTPTTPPADGGGGAGQDLDSALSKLQSRRGRGRGGR